MRELASLHRERMIARMLRSQYRFDSRLRWVSTDKDTHFLIDEDGNIYNYPFTGQNLKDIDSELAKREIANKSNPSKKSKRPRKSNLLSGSQKKRLYSMLMEYPSKFDTMPSGEYIVPLYTMKDKEKPKLVITSPDNQMPEIIRVFTFKDDDALTDVLKEMKGKS